MLDIKKFEVKTIYPTYTPSDSEKQKIEFVQKRFGNMKSARTAVDKNWWIYQKMIDANYVPYPDERSSSVVPLASSIIELFVAETNKLKTNYNFRWENSEHNTAAKVLEYVWKYDWRKKKRDKTFLKNEYITAGFGTSIIYTGFESYNKKQKDPIMSDDGWVEWVEKNIKKEDIIVKNVDIRQFYIDDQAQECIEEASDCIYDQWMSFEKFQDYSNSSVRKNIKYVSPKSYSNENKTFTNDEEKIKQWEFVHLRHYWNVERDMYVVIANGILVREHPMLSTIDGEKALPFVIRNLWLKNYSIYGRGFCEALMMFNSEVNNLRELLMDWIRRSNTSTLLIGNGLSFDGRTFSYDNEILTFDGNLANNFQQISGNPPNQAIFNYMVQLYKDIAIYIGIDIQNIIWQPQQTAFQTEVQREASQKRINVWLANRDLAFERFADLYKDLLQKYFPRKTAEWLYPTIEIEDEELKMEEKEETNELGEKVKVNKWRFRKKKGKQMLEVTPEMLRWDIYVDVYTNSTSPTINAVDREQKKEFLNTVWMITQWYAVAKQTWFDLEEILPMKKTISDLANDYNFETENKDEDMEWAKKAKIELYNQLKWMKENMWGGGMSAMWWEQTPEQQPAQWEAQTLPTNPAEWQMNMW
jgi:hypothetical protein